MTRVTSDSDPLTTWRRCTTADAETIAAMNEQLSRDEGAAPVGPLSAYVERMATWLEEGRYAAAVAESAGETVAYVVWRHDPDYADVFVRQFFVVPEHRGRGLGRRLFERAAEDFWPGQTLRLDVYDSNPRGGAFWESLGFVPFSRLMRRAATPVD
jgi:GNAT superfamily N-acetyltransferase